MPQSDTPVIVATQSFTGSSDINTTIFTPTAADYYRISMGANPPGGSFAPGFVIGWTDGGNAFSANLAPFSSPVSQSCLVHSDANQAITVSSNFSTTTTYTLYVIVEEL